MLMNVAACLIVWLGLGAGAQQVTKARVHENHLRTKAIVSFMPKFPEAARREKASGVAVAQIVVDTEGRVSSVQVLESPHPSCDEAVKEALYK